MTKIRFSLGYNQDKDMLKLLEKYKENIDYFYFPVPISYAGSGRIGNQSKDYQKTIKEIIKTCLNLGIKPLLLLNSTCDGKLIADKQYMNEVISYVKELNKIGLSSISLTNLLYVAPLKNVIPDIEIHSSVNCFIKDPEKADYLRQLGVDVITIDRDINYKLDIIEKIRSRTKLRLCLMLNEGCLRNCPFRLTHFNKVAHSYSNNKEVRFEEDSCFKLIKNNPHYLFRLQLIRPEDLKRYKNIVDIFKIVSRENTTSQIEKVLKAYIEEKYDGNLMDLISNTKKGNFPFLENSKIDSDKFFEKMNKCNMICEECNYCKDIYKKLVSE
jgi:collagenase-like PrtC family protease